MFKAVLENKRTQLCRTEKQDKSRTFAAATELKEIIKPNANFLQTLPSGQYKSSSLPPIAETTLADKCLFSLLVFIEKISIKTSWGSSLLHKDNSAY